MVRRVSLNCNDKIARDVEVCAYDVSPVTGHSPDGDCSAARFFRPPDGRIDIGCFLAFAVESGADYGPLHSFGAYTEHKRRRLKVSSAQLERGLQFEVTDRQVRGSDKPGINYRNQFAFLAVLPAARWLERSTPPRPARR
jgi:hypothetical protein